MHVFCHRFTNNLSIPETSAKVVSRQAPARESRPSIASTSFVFPHLRGKTEFISGWDVGVVFSSGENPHIEGKKMRQYLIGKILESLFVFDIATKCK